MIVAHGHEYWVARRIYLVWYSKRVSEGLLSSSVLAQVSDAFTAVDPAHGCHSIRVFWLELGWCTCLTHHVVCLVGLAREPLYHLLLVRYYLRILRNHLLQCLHTIVLLLEPHSNLTVATRARNRHIWALFFQMSFEFISSAIQFDSLLRIGWGLIHKITSLKLSAAKGAWDFDTHAIFELVLDDFFVSFWLVFAADLALEEEWVQFVFEVAVQGLARVCFFAHRAHHRQIPLSVITDHGLRRRIHHFIVCADFLPLLDASRAEDVLALATLFRLYYNSLANTADKVLVKLCIAVLQVFLALVIRADPAVRSRVDLYRDILS